VHDAAHSYIARRRLVDAVPENLLRLRMAELLERVDAWRAQLVDNVVSQPGNSPA
jgi:hypothetical protein